MFISNVIGICIILGLVAFSTAMIVGIVKRVREIQKEKKAKAQSTSNIADDSNVDEDNKNKEVSE